MRRLPLLTAHVVALAIVVAGIVRSGSRPQVLVFAFLLDYAVRFVVIRAMISGSREPAGPRRWLFERCSSRPAAGQASYPITDAESGTPRGLGAYAAAVLVLGFFAFVLANVNAERELDLTVEMLAHDARWAVALASLYLLETLVTAGITIDPAARKETNYGYNTRELTIMALAVLTSGMLVVVRQAAGFGASGWVVLGPLLFYRFLYDLAAAWQERQAEPVVFTR